ncbi:MAG: hypothetical protein ABH857_02205 [Elusimicrobiota bacterium]
MQILRNTFVYIFISGTLLTCLYAAADVTIKLETNDGSSGISIQDSSEVVVSTISSNGDAYFAGYLGVGTSIPSSPLYIYKNVIDGGKLLKMFDSVMSVTDAVRFQFGKEETNYNAVENTFSYVGDNSTSNYYTIGLYGKSIAHFVGTGRMGIGTTQPAEEIEVVGEIKANEIRTSTVSAVDASGLYLVDDGNNGIFIEDGGFVGIGTNNPGSKLQIGHSAATDTQSLSIVTSNGASDIPKIVFTRTGSESGFIGMGVYGLSLGISGTTTDPATDGTLFIDRVSGSIANVGIGTIAPAQKFEVVGIMKSSGVYARGADGLKLYDDGNNGIFIKDGGNVGIGTTNPLAKLDAIVSNGGYIRIRTGSVDGESAYLAFQDRATIGYSSYSVTGLSALQLTTPDKHIILNTNSTILDNYVHLNATGTDSIYFGTNGSTKMTIKSDGNVGIGTVAPIGKLQVAGDTIIGSGTSLLRMVGAGGALYIQPSSSTVTGSSADLYFSDWYQGTPKLVIKAGGNIGVGTNDPSEKLYVLGDIASSTTVYAPIGDFSDIYISTINTKSPLYINNAANNVLITGSGYVGIGTTNPTAPLSLSNDEPDIVFNDTGAAGYTTFTFQEAGVDKVAFGKNLSGDFYITRNDSGWQNDTFVIKRVGGNIGIGTTNPLALVSLNNSFGNTKLALYDGGSIFYGMGIQSNQFRLHVGNNSGRFSFLDAPAGNELFTIKGTGNVGIGTTAPGALLDLEKDYSVTTVISKIYDPVMSAGHALRINLGNADSTNNTAQLSYTHVGAGSASNYLSLGMYGSQTSLNVAGTGNVGIGITNPTKKLEVNGDMKFYGTEGSIFNLDELQGASDLRLSSSGKTNALYISSAGNVGIGDSTPTLLLDVAGNIGINGYQVIGSTHPVITDANTGYSVGEQSLSGARVDNTNAALNELGRKINQILDALRAHGLAVES